MAGTTSLPYILDHSGHKRPLGFIPGDPGRMSAIAPMGAADLIPESQWVEYDEWPEQVEIKDQDGAGACNGHAAALGEETLRWTAGMPHVPLSAWYLYSIMCNGVDRGSMILDALELLQDKGVSPEEYVTYGIINPRKLTAEAHKEAARFKVEIGERLTTYEQLGTAVQRRQPINLAVAVGNQFNNLNSDGVPPLARGYCNHAVHVGFGMKRAKDGSWLAKMANSWGTRWGLNGFCWLPLKYLPTAAAFEAYTLRASVDDTADTTRPPDLIA